MMSSDEIKGRHSALLEELDAARVYFQRIQQKMRDLEAECLHPRAYKSHPDNEFMHCPDCGADRIR